MAEHMTFNHGVRSSTLRWVTNRKAPPKMGGAFLLVTHRIRAELFELRENLTHTDTQTRSSIFRHSVPKYFDISDGSPAKEHKGSRRGAFLLVTHRIRAELFELRENLTHTDTQTCSSIFPIGAITCLFEFPNFQVDMLPSVCYNNSDEFIQSRRLFL